MMTSPFAPQTKTAPLPRHVTLVYPVGGKLHLIVAYLEGALDWRFGDVTIRPESDLPEVLAQAKAEGALVSDERTEARPDKPILIAYRVPLWHALTAETKLNRAIWSTVGRGEGLKRGQQ